MDKIKRICLGMANCYVIQTPEGAVLVDTGAASARRKLSKAIQGKNIKLIVLTHGHHDHVGNARFLAERVGAKIAMHPGDLEMARTGAALPLRGRSALGKAMCRVIGRPSVVRHETFEPDILLEDGCTLPGFPGIFARHLPGHTDGSVVLLANSGEDVIAGDLVFNILRPTEARMARDYEMVDKSMKALRQMGPKTIYPGHGKPVEATKFFAKWRAAHG